MWIGCCFRLCLLPFFISYAAYLKWFPWNTHHRTHIHSHITATSTYNHQIRFSHLVWLLFVLFILVYNHLRFRAKSRSRYMIFISFISSGHIFASIRWFWWHSLPLWRTPWVALRFYQWHDEHTKNTQQFPDKNENVCGFCSFEAHCIIHNVTIVVFPSATFTSSNYPFQRLVFFCYFLSLLLFTNFMVWFNLLIVRCVARDFV